MTEEELLKGLKAWRRRKKSRKKTPNKHSGGFPHKFDVYGPALSAGPLLFRQPASANPCGASELP